MSSSRFVGFYKALEERTATNRYRRLRNFEIDQDPAYVIVDGVRLLNACSNDYLTLSKHPDVIEGAVETCRKVGAGSTASRLVSGTRPLHTRFETDLAKHVQRERSLLFSSGYIANVSMISALVGRDDHVYIDRFAHNSLYQGTLLSGATMHRFRHNDLDHLKQLLDSHTTTSGKKLIVTESIFSMDGDSPDLMTLCLLADQTDALLYVDEAHSYGIRGFEGQGMAAAFPRVDIIGYMFGKAMGGMGGAVACNDVIAEYLINYAGGFIYSTAPPPQVLGGLIASLQLIKGMDQERAHLASISHMLRVGLQELGFSVTEGESPIIPVLIGSEAETMALYEHLSHQGILVGAIRPPTVPPGSSRIRMTITASHTPAHVNQIVDAFYSWKNLHI
jgi:8-amino-7-oxononanoate synthase